jgi:hypothetical protein
MREVNVEFVVRAADAAFAAENKTAQNEKLLQRH